MFVQNQEIHEVTNGIFPTAYKQKRLILSFLFHHSKHLLLGDEVQHRKRGHLISQIVALRAKILDLGNVKASFAAALGLRIL